MGLTALAGVLLPAAIGLALCGAAEGLARRFGPATAAAVAARAALAGGVLAALLLGSIVRQGAEVPRFWWVQVGRTTQIDWLVLLDPLALLFGGLGLAALLAAIVAGLALGPAAGARPHARAGLAAAAAVVVATSGSLWQAGLGLGLAGLALRSWSSAQEPRGMSPGPGWLGLGLGLAALGWLAGAGDLEFSAIERAGLLQGGSELVRGPTLAGLAPAEVAGVGVVVALLGWALAWPRVLARAWAEGPASALAITAAIGPAPLLVPLRGHLALALAPGALAWLVALASAAAAWAGLRAARARGALEIVGACAQVGLATAIAALAIGGFVEAVQLALVQALALAGVASSLAGASRRAVQATLATAAIGWTLALGAAVACLSAGLSAWSPGLNAAAPVLALVAAAGAACGLRRLAAEDVPGDRWSPDAVEAPGLLVGVAGALALAATLVAAWPLAQWLWPGFMFSRALVGAYAIGPRPDAWALPVWAATALVVAATVGGALALRRVPTRSDAGRRLPRTRLLEGLHGLGEGIWGGLVLRTGDERVAAAPGRLEVQRALLVASAGALAVVGAVFCNPDVLVLGPTRVHPVDLGGIDAAMIGARRAPTGEEAAGEEPQPPTPQGPRPIGPADLEDGRGGAVEGPAGLRASEGGAVGLPGEPGGGGAGDGAGASGAGSAGLSGGTGGGRAGVGGSGAGADGLSGGPGGGSAGAGASGANPIGATVGDEKVSGGTGVREGGAKDRVEGAGPEGQPGGGP